MNKHYLLGSRTSYNRFSNQSGRGKFDPTCHLCTHQSGRGIFSTIKKWFTRAKKVSNTAHKFATGNVGTAIRNALPSSDPLARNAFPGETHAVLRLSNGKYGQANYMGPGTRIIERVKRNDPPRTAADRVAQAHDIEYTLNPSDSRGADQRMIQRLKSMKSSGADNAFNITLGQRVIEAKMAAEKAGILNPDQFVKMSSPLGSSDRQLLRDKLTELEGTFKPGERLLKKVTGSGKRKRAKSIKKTKGAGIYLAGRSKRFRGSGNSLPGGGQNGSGKDLGSVLTKIIKLSGLTPAQIKSAAGITIGQFATKIKNVSKSPAEAAKKASILLAPLIIKGGLHALGVPHRIIQSGGGRKIPIHQLRLQKKLHTVIASALGKQSGGSLFSSIGSFFKTFAQAAIVPLAAAAVEVGTFGTATPFVIPAAAAAEVALSSA